MQYFRDERGQLWNAHRGEHGTWISPVRGASLPTPRGMGALGEASTVYFTWRAPSKISLGSFLTDGWNAAQSRLGNKLAARGVQISRITSEAISYFPQLRYALIVNGYAPAGIDGFEGLIADLADGEGFRVDRSGIEFHVGGSPRPGDGTKNDDEDDDSSGWMIPALIAAVAAAVIFRR